MGNEKEQAIAELKKYSMIQSFIYETLNSYYYLTGFQFGPIIVYSLNDKQNGNAQKADKLYEKRNSRVDGKYGNKN